MNPSDARLQFCINIAQQAGTLAKKMRSDAGDAFISEKGHQDFVTRADMAVERFIRQKIAESYPSDAILGEEEGFSGTSSTQWVIDPIDGTANYMRGLPEWAISIACVQDGVITHGVLDLPDLQQTASAQLGCGAFLNSKKMAVSTIKGASSGLILLGYSPRTGVEMHLKFIEGLLNDGWEYRRHGSACFGLFCVAAGWAEAYHEMHLNAWDAFAGMLLVSEAGGTVDCKPISEFLTLGSRLTVTNSALQIHCVKPYKSVR